MQTSGTSLDTCIAAWGMAFRDGAEVITVERSARMSLKAADAAPSLFALDHQVTSHLVWLTPTA